MRNAAVSNLLATASTTGLSLTDDAFAEHLDSMDRLKEHRASFHFPKRSDGRSYTYLVGHSLGLQHVGVEASVNAMLQKWRDQAVEGHFMQPNPWFEADQALQQDMATIVGAQASEVVIMNTLTVNLHLMLAAFYRAQGAKRKILIENHAFPSDTHCVMSFLEVHGCDPVADLITVSAPGHEDWRSEPTLLPTEVVLSTIEQRGHEIALVLLPAVQFVTGQVLDIETITKAAHAKGIVVGIDCAHGVGNVPLKLHDWDVDFAAWCTYKYLNSGPGNIGGAFVHRKHTQPDSSVKYLKGWWGHERKTRFSLHHNFVPMDGASAFQISNGPPHSLAMLAPSLKLMASIGVPTLREKSKQLTAYLELLLNEMLPPGSVEMITPADPEQRGAQLCIRILPNKLRNTATTEGESYESGNANGEANDAETLQRQLLAAGVMVDSRPPDIIRIAPVPLYNNHQDVLHAVRAIRELLV